MQRLFSSFANGWPGKGLLLQRLLIAAVLLYSVISHLGQPIPLVLSVLEMVVAAAGILVLAGLWTPVVGTLIFLLEIVIASFFAASPLIHVMVATISVTLAMIGPGAWSVDARRYGRKRIETRNE